MPDTLAAHKTVSRLGWLSTAPERFRNVVLQKCIFQKFEINQTVYSVGEPAGGIYGLVSGGLRVSVAPGEQTAFAIHLFVPGSWIGESAAITGRPRLVTISTTRQTQLLHLPLSAVNAILKEDSDAFRHFAGLAYFHLETSLGVVGDLMLRNPDKRVFALLLRLCGCRTKTPDELGVIDIDLGQEDLALMSNVGRTKASEILNALQGAGEIEIGYRRIRVLAPDAIRKKLLSETKGEIGE